MSLGTVAPLIESWVDNRLKTDTVIVSYVGDRVYSAYAPLDVAFPLVIHQVQDATSVRGVGTEVFLEDTLYVVKAIAQVSAYEPLRPIADRLEELFSGPTASVAGGEILACAKESPFQLVEVDGGRQFRHLGATFRIHAIAF